MTSILLTAKQYLAGFRIYLTNDTTLEEGQLIYTDTYSASTMPDLIHMSFIGVVGRYLWVSVRGDKMYLQLQEVSVFGSKFLFRNCHTRFNYY